MTVWDWIQTSSRRMQSRVDPAVAAFRDPARLAYSSWRTALRSDRRAVAGTVMIALLVAIAIYGAVAQPIVGRADLALHAPSVAHPFGTDDQGRDLLRALVQGAFPTLGPAALAALGAAAIGFALGALGGFLRGSLDLFLQRTMEALSTLPLLLVVLIAQALIPAPSAASLVLVIMLTRWSEIAQVIRADVLRVLQLDYVLAARALGAGPGRLLARHVLPSVLASAVVLSAFTVAAVIVVETAVAVIGIGYVHPLAWGALLGQARAHPGAWWLVLFPAGLVAWALGATVMLAEAIRDAFDPRLRWPAR